MKIVRKIEGSKGEAQSWRVHFSPHEFEIHYDPAAAIEAFNKGGLNIAHCPGKEPQEAKFVVEISEAELDSFFWLINTCDNGLLAMDGLRKLKEDLQAASYNRPV